MVANESAITYVIELTHSDKGIAFNARDALKRNTSPSSGYVVQARFKEEASSGRSTILVSLRGDRNEEYLREVLGKSHLIHPGAHLRIESIHPLAEEGSTVREGGLQAKLAATEERHQQARVELEQTKDENVRLKRRLETAGKVESPLEGLLNYFDQHQLDVAKVIDDEFDIRYLRKVLASEIEDTFFNYVNFGRETPLPEEEIQELEQFDYNAASQELTDLEKKVTEAQEQLAYMQGVEEGKIPVPAAVRQTVLDSLHALEPEKTIARYQELEGSIVQKRERQQVISKQRERYQALGEHRELLKVASREIPVIFNNVNDTVEIYFPFQSKKVKPTFIDDLTKDLQSSYTLNEKDVEPLEHKFLAYRVRNAGDIVEQMLVAIPFPLQVAGFNKIVRYQIGG